MKYHVTPDLQIFRLKSVDADVVIYIFLLGLCDNVPPETFMDHEQTFMMKSTPPVTVKTSKALDKPDAPWYTQLLIIDKLSTFPL